MDNFELVGAIMKAAKKFGPAAPEGQGGPGAGGPPADKKFLMMLNLMQPELPVPLVGRICGLNPPVAIEVAKNYEEKGLVVITEKEAIGQPQMFVTISDEGKALIEAERAEHMKQMEEQQKKHIAETNAKLSTLTEEEKETLAALLAKIGD